MNTTTTQGIDTSFRNSRTHIDSGRAVISFSTSNLLDEEIVLALKACIESHEVNDIRLLRHLEQIANGKIKL